VTVAAPVVVKPAMELKKASTGPTRPESMKGRAPTMPISAGGAAMLLPAAYSLVKAPEEAWIFWVPGVIVPALGAVLYYPTRRQPRGYVSRQSMFLMVVVCWMGVVLASAFRIILRCRTFTLIYPWWSEGSGSCRLSCRASPAPNLAPWPPHVYDNEPNGGGEP
jgi:hypothetical protein